ncbi:hypothetical protein PsYK624_162100 [Phanerochaete sordida]|uniref:JmjC domain-containing protein n=1 Tax=Phanerochaete sordida TaxID=48140 RepID=A0A9P3GVI2_9APHY|nr:hypothetical protein PsYK624_162100 [Phanerochaete sordida]
MAPKQTQDPVRAPKRKKEKEKALRPPSEDGKEVYMDPDDPAVRAARAHGCICGVWIPSRVKKTLDTWALLPEEYSTRRPRPRSHKKKQEGEDPAGGEHRILYFVNFFASSPIPADVQSVGLPGDVWVAPMTVQVYDGTRWLHWGPDAAQNGVFEHPMIPCFLGWKVEEHRLGYAGTADTVSDWEDLWDRDCTLGTFVRMKMGFESRIHPDAVAKALARAKELVSTTDVVTGLQVAVPYRSLSQEAIAALLFPLHDPLLPSFVGPTPPPSDETPEPRIHSTAMSYHPPQPHASSSVLTANSPAPSFGESALATMRPPMQPQAAPVPLSTSSPDADAPCGQSASAATNAAVTALTAPLSPTPDSAAPLPLEQPAPSSAASRPPGTPTATLPPDARFSMGVDLSDLPPGFSEEMLKDLPDAAFLRFTTGHTEVLSPYMHDSKDPDGHMARTMGQGQHGYLQLPESDHETHFRSSDAPFVILRREQFRDKGSSDIEIAAAIVEHLQVGQVVVMDDCAYPHLPWGLETFAHLSGGAERNGEYYLGGEVEWQSAAKRVLSRDNVYKGFTEVGTWLDFTRMASPRLLSEVPEGGDTSFEAPVNIPHLTVSMDTTGSAPFLRELRDDVKAEDMLSRRLRHAKTVHVDNWNSRSWVVVSSPGYQTYTHVDGSGQCTFVIMTHGRKWWAVLKMKRGCNHPKKVRTARQKMKEAFEHYVHIADAANDYQRAPVEIPNLATIHFVLLKPGMILIQPPGVFHEVYTPVCSIAIGGHFFTEETLHLTLQCRLAIQHSGGRAANTFHPSANRRLARMLLALVERGDTEMNQRGLISLARMLKQRKSHFSVVDFVKDKITDDDLMYDDTEFEIKLACDLADAILAHNSLSWEELKLHARAAYPFFPGDDVLPWYECGTAMVAFPAGLKDMMIHHIEEYKKNRL